MIYFLYGPDSFRSRQKLQDIIEGYKKVHKSGLNLVYIDAKEKSFSDFISGFKITSMFAEKKLIILKNTFASTKFCEEFLEEIKSLQERDDLIVVYEDETPDQRTKIFKALQKNAKCQSFDLLSPAIAGKWAQKKFEEVGVKINMDALSLLLNFTGSNLWRLSNEIEKLANFKKGGTVVKADVDLLVRPNIENDIFKTIDSLASKNKKEALMLLHKHLDNGDNTLYLLSMVAYQFKNLLIVKELLDSSRPASLSGLHPFVIKKSTYLCSQFSFDQLKDIYAKIFQMDGDIKTGKIDAELALDMFVSQI